MEKEEEHQYICPPRPNRKRTSETLNKNEFIKDKEISKNVRRKLCFEDHNEREEGTFNISENTTFAGNLENLLNETFEENRKRCIDKYNFDPMLEKPLEGKYIWKKVVDSTIEEVVNSKAK